MNIVLLWSVLYMKDKEKFKDVILRYLVEQLESKSYDNKTSTKE